MKKNQAFPNLVPTLYHWIKTKEEVIVSDTKCQLHICNTTLYGSIAFYEDEIIELSITHRQTKENMFYLHFQLHDVFTSIEQLNLFFQFFNHQQNIPADNFPIQNILLTCTSGLTSSYFAHAMQTILDEEKINISVDATNIYNLDDVIHQYDVILLAPQVAHLLPTLQSKYKQKIYEIETIDFATSNFNKILEKTIS